ncbi:MAG TPA: lamin tail domain-containing protein [Steroidobacteraceae bacterium]|jgi:hypothetical protein
MRNTHGRRLRFAALAATGLGSVGLVAAQNAAANIVITEVDAAGSGTTAYGADWFELTNTGSAAVDISGWRMDDDSAKFGNAVALNGVSSIGAGKSVIFIEDTGATDSTLDQNFTAAWFGSSVPAGLTIGNYGGSGVGLSTNGDQVNIFDASGVNIAKVLFGTSVTGHTFDNTAEGNAVTLTTTSVAGVNGAFNSVTSNEVGSPGVPILPTPLPAAAWLMLSGLGLMGSMVRRRAARSVA